ncbi:MAG TPA: hypothetical protein VJN96_05700 [Vicinamibacterales bacterium]|nr:hypothetical protein [Vicinamibacterales bacterium]
MRFTFLLTVAFAALYWFPIRWWMSRWGTRPSDLTRVMAGDGLLVDPTYSGTTAVVVNAPPEHIWPWLLQMGYQRGGLYSYDWLDRLFGYLDRPSATRILPEFQHLAVGDAIPLGRGPSWPVAAIEPNRALVLDMRNLGAIDWVWQFALYPIDGHRTQLVSRSRVRTRTTWARLLTYAIEPAGFVMTRRMLLGLKERAEALRIEDAHMTRVNQPSILVFTLFSIVVAAGFNSPGLGRQTAQSVPSTADRVAQMRHHFLEVTLVNEAVIRGDLAAVGGPALKVARVAMPAGMPASAESFIAELRRTGQRAAEAKTIEAAARATADMVTACANCHRAVGAYPSPPMPPRRDVGGIVGQMREHQLALDDMLLGLMIPSPSYWRQGADRLRVVPLLPARIPPDLKVTDETRQTEVRTHQLAEQALEAESVTDRTEIYAKVIANCSQCHSLHSKVWGPGRGGSRR